VVTVKTTLIEYRLKEYKPLVRAAFEYPGG